jgi:hypothetical protein
MYDQALNAAYDFGAREERKMILDKLRNIHNDSCNHGHMEDARMAWQCYTAVMKLPCQLYPPAAKPPSA